MLVAVAAASPSTTSLPLTKPWANIPVRKARRYNEPAILALTRGDVAEIPSIIPSVFILVSPYAKTCRRRRRRVIRNDQSRRGEPPRIGALTFAGAVAPRVATLSY